MRVYSLIVIALFGLFLTGCDYAQPIVTGASLPLENVFTGNNVLGGTAEIRYPTGWFLSGEVDTGLQFANQESMLQARPERLTGDQIFGGIVVIPVELAGNFTGEQPPTPLTIMQAFLSVFSSDDVTLSEAITVLAGTRDAAQITGTSANGDVYFITAVSDEAFFIVFGATAQGAMRDYQSTFAEMAARATYTP